jgi:phasin family protein
LHVQARFIERTYDRSNRFGPGAQPDAEQALRGWAQVAEPAQHVAGAIDLSGWHLHHECGSTDLSLEFAGLARATFESAAAAGAALVDARSLEDVTAIQNEFARTCIARLLAQGTRFSELGLKAATEVYEPLSARAGKAMSVLGRPYAS